MPLEPTLSVAKSLYLGKILSQNIFPFPTIKTSEAETIRMVLGSVDRFMETRTEAYRAYDKEGEQPAEYIQNLRELGLFGLIIPEMYGGIGLSNTGYSRVLQQASGYDASTALTVGAHSSIGLKGLLLFGNESQKQRYLPKLASGEMIAAFCLTEPGAGSDAASIKTTATKNGDGTWTLSGEKIWITNGPLAQFFTVFAKTESASGSMSAFIVEKEFGGITTGHKEDKMGIRGSATTSVLFNETKIPAENLLGEEGKGFKVAMTILNNGRTGLGGGCVGAMKRCIGAATQQAKDRKQFGKAIATFPLIREKLALMSINCYATESVVSMVGHYIDSGSDDYSTEAAISKVFATEALWNVADEGLQIAGGNGFMREYPYERVVRDSRINRIFEGTNEILRLYIALSGFKEAGEYLKEIGRSAGQIFNDPIKGFGLLSGYAQKRFSETTALGRDRMEGIHPTLQAEAETMERYVLVFAQSVENSLKKYGKKIVDQQLNCKRTADCTIDLFVALCTLARASQPQADETERQLARAFVQQAKRRINQNVRRLTRNDDLLTESIAERILESGGYRWDTI